MNVVLVYEHKIKVLFNHVTPFYVILVGPHLSGFSRAYNSVWCCKEK